MSKIAQAFARGKAFIPFITCGDPNLETTAAAVRAAVENGADLIELGIPFSDPTAEGPVIQGANLRALQGGVTTDQIFGLVRDLRRDVTIPLAFMTYANVVFSYGAERFFSACRETGIDGLILPDLPFEEKEEFLPVCRRYGVELISLIAPTSKDRIAMIAREADGFLYLVSSLGVTGARSEIKTDLASMMETVRQNTHIPAAIGFGISTPEQAKRMAELADGVIVGSAIVKLLEQHGKDAPGCIGVCQNHEGRDTVKISQSVKRQQSLVGNFQRDSAKNKKDVFDGGAALWEAIYSRQIPLRKRALPGRKEPVSRQAVRRPFRRDWTRSRRWWSPTRRCWYSCRCNPARCFRFHCR